MNHALSTASHVDMVQTGSTRFGEKKKLNLNYGSTLAHHQHRLEYVTAATNEFTQKTLSLVPRVSCNSQNHI